MKRSKTVTEKMDELYAKLATIAAQRAIDRAKDGANPINAVDDAQFWAEIAGEWLDKSSASAVRWTYQSPRT